MWDVEQFAKSECVYCFCFWIKFIQSISLICLILISFSIGSLILKSVRARFTWLIIDVPAWWYPFVNETFPILWMGRWRAIEWPARSPDLNPLNFFTKLLQSQCIFFFDRPNCFLQVSKDIWREMHTLEFNYVSAWIAESYQNRLQKLKKNFNESKKIPFCLKCWSKKNDKKTFFSKNVNNKWIWHYFWDALLHVILFLLLKLFPLLVLFPGL